MTKIWHIAANTFLEAVRDKVLYVIAFFAVLMMAASLGLGFVSAGQEEQIVQHFSLAVLSFFGALLAVFIGTGLIYKEIDKRTIYTILSKPVRRWEFVVGKFAGLLAVLGCIVLGIGTVALLFTAYSAWSNPTAEGMHWAAKIHWGLYIQALVLIFFELMIVTALAIFFSTVSSPILAAIFTFAAYLVGQVTRTLLYMLETFQPSEESMAAQTGEHLSDFASDIYWFLAPLSRFLYYILPDLGHFHLRNRVVYGPPVDHGQWFFDGEVGMAMIYGVLYSAAVLLVAALCFDRKRF